MIDPTKTYKTRSGLDVRIYATDGHAHFCVHGAVLIDGKWHLKSWSINGASTIPELNDAYDLIESRPIVHVKGYVNVYYVNVYEDSGLGGTYETREKADSGACPGRIACIHVDVTGERL